MENKEPFELRFSASRLGDPITPDEVVLTEKGVAFVIKEVFSQQDNFVFYEDISGVEIDSGIMLSNIRIMMRARPPMTIENFSNSDAQEIKTLILQRV